MNISIVTVCYNDKIALEKTYSSVEHYLGDVTWVVVDGGSSDGTQDLLYKYEKLNSNVIAVSEKDSGIYDAMNKGTYLANGRYVLFLNAGDTLLPSKELFFNLREYDEDLIFCDAVFVYPNGKRWIRKARDFSKIWHSIPANHQCIFFKKSILHSHSYDIGYNICGDYALLSTLWISGASFKKIKHNLVEFAVGGVSTQQPFKLMVEAIRVQKDMLKLGFIKICLSLLLRCLTLSRNYVASLMPSK